MRKRLTIIIVSAGLFIFPALAQNPPQDKNWQVVFEDNFSTFNTTRWHKSHDGIHGNGKGEEPQVYIRDNVYIENGSPKPKLVLKTVKLNSPYQWLSPPYQCPKGNQCWYGSNHYYTSGQISSNVAYKYGYFEIYAKLPGSKGYWPAFWFWNQHNAPTNCWYNEIDVFEIQPCITDAYDAGYVYGFTCPNPTNEHGDGSKIACNYASGYHWYGLEWDRDKITWYLDRKIVKQEINNMGGKGIQNPMYIIINVALHPNSGLCPIDPNTTIFPNYMYVDQANAYKLIYDCSGNTAVVNEISNYNTFNYAVKKSISLSGASSLSSGQNVSLRASDFIELKAGFEVPVGAELYLDINPCE